MEALAARRISLFGDEATDFLSARQYSREVTRSYAFLGELTKLCCILFLFRKKKKEAITFLSAGQYSRKVTNLLSAQLV